MALRLSALLVVWLILSLAFGLSTFYFPSVYASGLFYVLCAACGAPGLLMFKSSPWGSLIIVPALAVASAVVVGVMRLGYFGL